MSHLVSFSDPWESTKFAYQAGEEIPLPIGIVLRITRGHPEIKLGNPDYKWVVTKQLPESVFGRIFISYKVRLVKATCLEQSPVNGRYYLAEKYLDYLLGPPGFVYGQVPPPDWSVEIGPMKQRELVNLVENTP